MRDAATRADMLATVRAMETDPDAWTTRHGGDQLPDVEHVVVTAGTGVPTSALVLST